MKKHGAARIVRLILLALALALLIFVMAFPFFYMFTSSFKQDTDVFTKSMFYIPIPPNWNNYVRVWTEINFLQYYLNTIKITVVATALQFLVSAMAAYAFARMEVPLKNFFFGLFISTMMIPWTAVMIPQFILISKMHLYDTHLALILLQLFSSFGISALVIFTIMKVWNYYLAPLIYLQTPEKRTVQLGLSLFRSQYSMEYSVVMAGTVCALLPILILYFCCEKQITEGIAFSGMKN